MQNRFKIGQKVRAIVTAQGLVEGFKYTVTDVGEWGTMFGVFVNYAVQETPSHNALIIRNGHLLLTEA